MNNHHHTPTRKAYIMIDWTHITLYALGFFLAVAVGVESYSRPGVPRSTMQIMTVLFALIWPLFALWFAIRLVAGGFKSRGSSNP